MCLDSLSLSPFLDIVFTAPATTPSHGERDSRECFRRARLLVVFHTITHRQNPILGHEAGPGNSGVEEYLR